MKRFLLFRGYNYYPYGGWCDFHGSYDTLPELREVLADGRAFDWYQIVDSTTGTVIET